MVAVMAADPLHHVGGLLAGWLANQPARTARQPACPPCIVPAVKRAGTSYTWQSKLRACLLSVIIFIIWHASKRVIIMSDYMTAGTCGACSAWGRVVGPCHCYVRGGLRSSGRQW